ncbi:TolC family protein [Rhabdochlamydiaceae symbiont of Dictyostelium giganteum]|uniref:TolC family protein n=1 Tax=Rhabdochlamydiaceae symbiont of Dictyostelium giganteum TaxID=3342349 RepID=UPI00384F3867
MKERVEIWVILLWVSCSCTASRSVIDQAPYSVSQNSSYYAAPITPEKALEEELPSTLTLEAIIHLALSHNPSTAKAWAEARVAAATWRESQSGDFPIISGGYQLSRSKEPVTAALSPEVISEYATEWGPQLDLTYTLLDFGQTSMQIQAAKEALLSADCLHRYQIQTTLQQTLFSYYSYLSQQNELTSQELNVNTAALTEHIVEKEVTLGIKDASDLLQAKTELLKAQIEVALQKQKVIEAKANLLTQIGMKCNHPVEIEACFDKIYSLVTHYDTEALLKIALAKRSDLLSSQASLRAQEFRVKGAKRQFFPEVTYDLSAFTGRVKPGGDVGINYSSVIALNIPLFSGFSSLNQLEKEKSLRDVYAASLKQSELLVREQVITCHAAMQTSTTVLELAKAFEKASLEQYEAALGRYQAGVGSILELTTSQNTLGVARSQLVKSQTELLSAFVNLHYVTGLLAPLS